MTVLAIAAVVLVIGVVLVLFARHGGPTRSVAHILYDVEHPPRDLR